MVSGQYKPDFSLITDHCFYEVEALQPQNSEAGICTETLARLYLQQGFVERALAIYRRLVQEQPNNPQLYERLYALEQQLTLGALGQGTAVPPTVPRAAVDTTMATHHHERRVVAQLERWLHYLQRQHRGRTEHGKR